MIVADTNLICYFLIFGEYSDFAEKVFIKDHNWIAPLLWRSEFRNVLLGYIRKKLITYEDALELTEQAEKQMKGFEFQVSSAEVLKLAQDSDCSAYDCEFVALAKYNNIKLVTTDKKVLKSFPETAVSLKKFVEIQ